MALPLGGDGTQQAGDGHTSEVLNVGRSGQSVQIGGTAAATVGLYGATPVVQRATAASHTTIGTTVGVSTLTTGSTSTWGYATSTQANQITAAVAEIQATLVALGVWAA